MNLDELLNPRQKEAATYLDSHLRIIAGAGSEIGRASCRERV